ncbi:unnamed protein product [Boreogadus saida]
MGTNLEQMRCYDNQPTEMTTLTGSDGKRVGIARDQERNALPCRPLDRALLRGRPQLRQRLTLPLAPWLCDKTLPVL